jgi:hypothetical protein
MDVPMDAGAGAEAPPEGLDEVALEESILDEILGYAQDRQAHDLSAKYRPKPAENFEEDIPGVNPDAGDEIPAAEEGDVSEADLEALLSALT